MVQNTLTPFDALQRGFAAHRAGQAAEAERLYEFVIRVWPNQFDAHHLLGVLKAEGGQQGEAERHIKKALSINPRSAEALNSHANVLQHLKRYNEALATCDRALEIKPDFAEALNNRGNILHDLGRHDEALASFARALTIRPGYFKALYNRGLVLQDLKRPDAAVASFDAALASNPGHAEAWNSRGTALYGLRRLDEALASFGKALAINPAYAEALCNRGLVLRALNRPEEALAHFDQALAIRPHYPEALNNRGIALKDLKRVEAALAAFAKAQAQDPDNAEAHLNEGLCRLVLGDFQRGWQKYEWRWETEQQKSAKRVFSQPLWLGKEDIAGKRILLHAEQGLGDTIQFCRYARMVMARGASVVLEVQPELKSLMGSLGGASIVIGWGETPPPFDLHCPLLSLPLSFNTTLDTIPDETPYLAADPNKVATWSDRLARTRGAKIGIVWAGNPRAHLALRRRSMHLSQFAPLAQVAGVSFVSLQKGDPAEQAGSPPAGMQLIDWTKQLTDFSETAALVEALSLVIAIDTSVAHLAGALGKPIWLLDQFEPEWRWLVEREDSSWYPTMRIFRQPRPGDWDSAMDRVAAELACWIARRRVVELG